MKITFAELGRQYKKYQKEYEEEVLRVMRSGWYILGNELKAFEEKYADFHGVKHCVGVGNGLDALRLSLAALGIENGDEVIVQANTFIATALAVSENGATPVFVDTDNYFGIDVNAIEKAITSKTKAIIVAHLYGQMCDMSNIMKIAKLYGLYVIEDCAQSHGATYKGKLAGTIGDIGCFSFYPMKPVGAFGDAGCIITNDDHLTERIRMLRNYGSSIKYNHEMIGINSRMDEIQAAIVTLNLKHLKDGNSERQRIANIYLTKIKNPKIKIPSINTVGDHVFHVFPLLVQEREKLQNYLLDKGIQTQIHYPIPCHLACCYKGLGYERGSFPMAEEISKKELSLPIYVGLKEDEIEYIINCINQF